jgi:SAM-dependent methyltransferase
MKPFRFHTIPAYAEVAKLLGRPRTILDIGCSEGFFLGELQGAQLRVGVDRDFERLRLGRRDRPGIAFVRADAAALPFADAAFESVVSIGVLSYLPNAGAAISEGARVLKPSGRLIVTAATDRPLYSLLATHVRRQGARLLRRSEIAVSMAQTGLVVAVSYEKGYIAAPVLNLLYAAASLLDRRVLRQDSVLGPLGRWTRTLTHPLIRLEYRMQDRTGNTIYLAADKER